MERGKIVNNSIEWEWFVTEVKDLPIGRICSKILHYYDTENYNNNMLLHISPSIKNIDNQSAILLLPYVGVRNIENKEGLQLEVIITPQLPDVIEIPKNSQELQEKQVHRRVVIHGLVPPSVKNFPSEHTLGEMQQDDLLKMIKDQKKL